ncbi:Uncharacterized protein Rs2_17906 [Raphanus sativus]|nr:Uncharacterized protein Rs2_17906 [Raphanus sativus]
MPLVQRVEPKKNKLKYNNPHQHTNTKSLQSKYRDQRKQKESGPDPNEKLLTTQNVDSTDTLQAHVFRSQHTRHASLNLFIFSNSGNHKDGTPDFPLKLSTSLDTPEQTGVHDLHNFFTAIAFNSGVYFIGEHQSLVRDSSVTVRAHTHQSKDLRRETTLSSTGELPSSCYETLPTETQSTPRENKKVNPKTSLREQKPKTQGEEILHVSETKPAAMRL